MVASDTSDVYHQRIATLMSLRRFDEAARTALEWLTAFPNDAEPHAHLAWALLSKGDDQGAEEQAGEACRLAPEWDWPLRLLAGVLFNRGDYPRSFELTKECLRLAPWNSEYHYFLARNYDALDQRENALIANRRAIELAPENAEYRRQLHEREFFFQQSEAEMFQHFFKLRAVLALDPNHAATLADLAKFHDRYLDDSVTAERLLREALEIEPENQLFQVDLNSTIQRRDAWSRVLFHLAIPVGFWVTGLNLFARKWQPIAVFYLYCIIFCLTCGLPLAAVFVLPWMIYEAMAYLDDRTERGATSLLTAAKRLLFGSVWVRRIIGCQWPSDGGRSRFGRSQYHFCGAARPLLER